MEIAGNSQPEILVHNIEHLYMPKGACFRVSPDLIDRWSHYSICNLLLSKHAIGRCFSLNISIPQDTPLAVHDKYRNKMEHHLDCKQHILRHNQFLE